MKKVLSLILVVVLIFSVSIVTFDAAPAFYKDFETYDDMCAYIERYSADYPNVEYAYGGLNTQKKGYELKLKDFLVVSVNNEDYTLTNICCWEPYYNHGINSTHSSYVKSNGYTEFDISVYYDLSEENVTASLDKLEAEATHGDLYTGEISGYRYVVCDDGFEDGVSTVCNYTIAVDDVLIKINSNSFFDKAFLNNIVIKKSGIKIPVLEVLPEEVIEVSDELLEAVGKDHPNREITKEDIRISNLETIDDTKQLVRYSLTEACYPSVYVEKEIGEYLLYVSQPPLPMILTDGVLYDIDEAYEKGVLCDTDLEVISAFEPRGFGLIKIEDLYGDADGDHQITVFDATAVQRYLVGNYYLGSYEKYADFDRDGEISIFDATAIQRKIAGL